MKGKLLLGLGLVLGGIVLGYLAGQSNSTTLAQQGAPENNVKEVAANKKLTNHMRQSEGAVAPVDPENDFGLGDCHVSKLLPYPNTTAGARTPFDLYRYAGRGK
ncbi:MAG: hypothetical protein NXI22_10360, partial [bacterium]|nr:hypothetical protein [bacterium]